MIREGFTLKTALRESFKPQSSARMRRGFVEALGFSVLFEKAYDLFRWGNNGRYTGRRIKPDCPDDSGESPGTRQVSCCVSVHLRLYWRGIRRSLSFIISAAA
jgi:hypothetical protein